jgi:histidinol dehydrogenase
MANQILSLEERLNAHPQLKGCMESLLALVEGGNAEVKQADEAERRVIEEVRRLGHEALRSWAAQQEGVQSAAVSQQGAARAGKKNSTGTPRLGR